MTLATVSHEGERHLPALDPESINHYRHLTAYHFVRAFLANVDVLDYGCGTGYGFNLLWRRAGLRSALGLDVSAEAIDYCKWSFEDVADRFRLVPPGEVPVPDEGFDAVLLFQVLEHVPDDVALLTKLRRAMRPGGKLFLTTPNVQFSGGDPEHPENPHHVREYSREALRAVCGKVFAAVEELGIGASLRAGGAGLGIERYLAYRGLRRVARRFRPPRYVAPVSLADFAVAPCDPKEALDLLFVCQKGTA